MSSGSVEWRRSFRAKCLCSVVIARMVGPLVFTINGRPSPLPLSLISGLLEISTQGVEVGNSRLRGGRGVPRASPFQVAPEPRRPSFSQVGDGGAERRMRVCRFTRRRGGAVAAHRSGAGSFTPPRPSWSPLWRPSTSSREIGHQSIRHWPRPPATARDVGARAKAEHDAERPNRDGLPSPGWETMARSPGSGCAVAAERRGGAVSARRSAAGPHPCPSPIRERGSRHLSAL